jgi:hypothetical protein
MEKIKDKKLFEALFPEKEIDEMVKKRKADIQSATYFFHQRLILLDSYNKEISGQCKPYHVKFYDEKTPIVVRATNFRTAGILAMASRIHSGESWGIEYVENMTGVRVPVDIKD